MSFKSFLHSIKSPPLIEIAEHWRAVSPSGKPPAWRDIDPATIRQHLPIVWAWRYDAAQGDYVGRLAGETIAVVLGMQIRGRRFADCFPPRSLAILRERFDRVLNGPCVMRSAGRVYVTSGRHGQGERISLPLSDSGAACDGILGATVYTFGSFGPEPRDPAAEHADEDIAFFEI